MKKTIINCLRVNIKDNVVTLIKEITVDEELIGQDVPSGLRSCSSLKLGHKIAIGDIGEGDRIIKYGEQTSSEILGHTETGITRIGPSV